MPKYAMFGELLSAQLIDYMYMVLCISVHIFTIIKYLL